MKPQEEIKYLKETIEHLKACKEFESNLQNEVIALGMKFMHTQDGKTYTTDQAWNAIKRKLGV
jgi:hypothetical protein